MSLLFGRDSRRGLRGMGYKHMLLQVAPCIIIIILIIITTTTTTTTIIIIIITTTTTTNIIIIIILVKVVNTSSSPKEILLPLKPNRKHKRGSCIYGIK